MSENSNRKTFFILALALSLIVALVAVVVRVIQDEELQERLGTTYYILTLAIIGCVLLVMTGYLWDRTLMQRLKTLRTSVGSSESGEAVEGDAHCRRVGPGYLIRPALRPAASSPL